MSEGEVVAVPTGRRAKPTAEVDESDSALRAYMQSMGECPTFTVEQEQAAAEQLWVARAARWAALLGYPPLVPGIRAAIAKTLEIDANCEVLLERVGVSGEEFRLRRTLANEAEFAEACKLAADELAKFDIDCELAERLIADVERLARNEREGLVLDIPRMPGDSRPFRGYLERCRVAQARVRRLVHQFARANLRLVVSLARRLALGRLPLQDLIQEGNLGLLKAIDRFDHRRGFRFSTYAAWWIRHAISRAIYNKARQVRLPVHVHDVQQKIARTRRNYEVSRGREPTLDELALETGVPAAKLDKIVALELGPILSLDAPVSRADERTGVDLLEDEDGPLPGFPLEAEEIAEGLEAALAVLKPMEADILRRRFGLAGSKQETLREIGDRYALSRERIRQLQERAVGRIREEFDRMELL
ncbi:sigma-70 family RNA polymerase sigma factor [Nannocystaceae bacterium ST9]